MCFIFSLNTLLQSDSYEGEDYEKILVRATLAIADLFDGEKDAQAYAYQITAKQNEIVQNGVIDDPRNSNRKINPKKAYPRIALGPYIEGLLWEQTYVNASDAARCYEKVVNWQPNFKQGRQDLIRAQTGVHPAPRCRNRMHPAPSNGQNKSGQLSSLDYGWSPLLWPL